MSEPLAPRGLFTQSALLLGVGAALGGAAVALGPSDFAERLQPPPEVGAAEVLAEGAEPPGAAAVPARLRMVSFLDLRAELYGRDDVTLVDARDEASFEQAHIPGAVPMDAELALSDARYRQRRQERVPREHVVVVYCSGGDCDLSKRLGNALLADGYRRVLVFEGGFNEWVAEGEEQAQGPFDPDATRGGAP